MARFQARNRAAVGNRGGGRPPKLLREITTADAARVWRELKAIAFKRDHPLHARYAFHALRMMAQLTFPRPLPAPPEEPGPGYLPLTLLDLLSEASDEPASGQTQAPEYGAGT